MLVALMVCAPRILYSTVEIADPFSYSSASLTSLYLGGGHIVINPFTPPLSPWQSHVNELSVRIGPPTLTAFLSLVTGLPVSSITLAPIGGLLFLLLAFALGRILSKSNLVAALFATLVALDPQVIRATNTTFYVTLGFTLLVAFGILYLKVLETPRVAFLIPLTITFVALYFTYYSAEFYALALMVSMSVLQMIRKVATRASHRAMAGRPPRDQPRLLLSLALAFLVIFLGLDTIIVQFLRIRTTSEPVVSYPGSTIAGFFGLAYEGLLIAAVGIFLTAGFTQSFRREQKTIEPSKTTLYLAFVLATTAFAIPYGSLGLINSRPLLIFFPLLALNAAFYFRSAWRKRPLLRRIPLAGAIVAIALATASSGTFLTDTSHPYAPYQISDLAAGIAFLVSNSETSGETRIMSGLDISAETFYVATSSGRPYVQTFVFSTNVSALYSEDPAEIAQVLGERRINFMVLPDSYENRAIFADGWFWSPPVPGIITRMSGNPALSRVYDDGRAVTFFVSLVP